MTRQSRMSSAEEPLGFFRAVALRDGESASGRIGALEVSLHRRATEWWVAHRSLRADEQEGPVHGSWRVGAGVEAPDPGAVEGLTRHVFTSCPEEVVVRPALADRDVMARPRIRLSVAPGQDATVFAGTPIWVEVVAAGTTLASLPVVRPKDTWFGPSPDSGELCYAVRTRARLQLDAGESPDHAVTVARIENRTDDVLALDFLRIPAPYLSLYRDENGGLWTEAIRLEREEEGEHAVLEIVPGRPAQAAAGAERLAAPRLAAPARGAFHAFQRKALATLFGD